MNLKPGRGRSADPSCKKRSDPPKADPPGPAGREAVSLPVLGRAPAFALTDQSGAPFVSRQLEGAPWVANFMFTTCPTICPRQTG